MPKSKPIFFDPDRKRWRRLRLVLDTSVIVATVLVVFFVATIIRGSSVPGVLLPLVKKPYHALKESQKHKPPRRLNTHRKTKRPASQVVLNSDEGIRGAFYVQWDAASFASLKEYYPQIDLLFPEWMHALTADGRLQAVTELNTLYNMMDDKGKPRSVDERVMPFLKGEKAQTDVLPLVNNFDPIRNEWQPDVTAKFMADPAARQRFRSELMSFLATDQYKGITLDIEAFPESSRGDFRALVQELYADLHAKGLKLFIACLLYTSQTGPDAEGPLSREGDRSRLGRRDSFYSGPRGRDILRRLEMFAGKSGASGTAIYGGAGKLDAARA